MLAFFNKQHKEDKQQENTIDKYDLVRYENADAAMTAMLKQKQTNGKKWQYLDKLVWYFVEVYL